LAPSGGRLETFTDPARHLGTCYKASNFTLLGTTSGFGRRAGRFVHHGGKKAYWLKTLRRDALRLLASDFDPQALVGGMKVRAADLNRLDLKSLLDELARVPDPRMRRGIRHQLPQILAIATLGTLWGAMSLFAIGELAAELPQEALCRLGCRISPRTARRQAPEESTIRRTLKVIDADALDLVVNAWVASQVASGRLEAEDAVEIDFSVMVEEDERSDDNGDSTGGAIRDALALDGKTLRGARLDDRRKVASSRSSPTRSGRPSPSATSTPRPTRSPPSARSSSRSNSAMLSSPPTRCIPSASTPRSFPSAARTSSSA